MPHSSRSNTTLSSTPCSGSGPSSSKQPTMPTWPGFTSVVQSQTKGLAKKASVNHTLKVIVASINHVDGDKPSFNKRDLVYISISESTATLPHVLSAVCDQLGEEYIMCMYTCMYTCTVHYRMLLYILIVHVLFHTCMYMQETVQYAKIYLYRSAKSQI